MLLAQAGMLLACLCGGRSERPAAILLPKMLQDLSNSARRYRVARFEVSIVLDSCSRDLLRRG